MSKKQTIKKFWIVADRAEDDIIAHSYNDKSGAIRNLEDDDFLYEVQVIKKYKKGGLIEVK